ncbi:hypothetical protein MCOR12_001092 [Pyricularia oryzae]|nr:hypothetical protein MCOR12_001092 [Pyricularia oryzae]
MGKMSTTSWAHPAKNIRYNAEYYLMRFWPRPWWNKSLSSVGEADIGLVNTQGLKYVNAVVNESLRIHTPVSGSGPRIAALSGTTIIGHYIPENTIVGINIWAVHHGPNSFNLPESFVPERWLGDGRFMNDRLDAVEFFSTGPRSCIGKK